MELVGDLFGRQVLVDQKEAIQLARAQPRNAARDQYLNFRGTVRSRCRVGQPSSSPNATPHWRENAPESVVA